MNEAEGDCSAALQDDGSPTIDFAHRNEDEAVFEAVPVPASTACKRNRVSNSAGELLADGAQIVERRSDIRDSSETADDEATHERAVLCHRAVDVIAADQTSGFGCQTHRRMFLWHQTTSLHFSEVKQCRYLSSTQPALSSRTDIFTRRRKTTR